MKNKAFPFFLIAFVLLIAAVVLLEKPKTADPKQEFIESVSLAIDASYEDKRPYKSVIIAQAILESQWGQSQLTQDANNYFGIKGSFQGDSVSVETQEVKRGEWITIQAPFRKYPSLHDSVRDYITLMNNNRYKHVIQISNYRDQATAIMNAGYATDPGYAPKLIEIIETYRLYEYDQ